MRYFLGSGVYVTYLPRTGTSTMLHYGVPMDGGTVGLVYHKLPAAGSLLVYTIAY